jgi:hypothetical protein
MYLTDRTEQVDWPASGLSSRDLWLLVMSQALCAHSGFAPDQWYPISETASAARREAEAAIAICHACPVRTHCLELSLRHWSVGQHGIWGGTVRAEREAWRERHSGETRRNASQLTDADHKRQADSCGAARRGTLGQQCPPADSEERAS